MKQNRIDPLDETSENVNAPGESENPRRHSIMESSNNVTDDSKGHVRSRSTGNITRSHKRRSYHIEYDDELIRAREMYLPACGEIYKFHQDTTVKEYQLNTCKNIWSKKAWDCKENMEEKDQNVEPHEKDGSSLTEPDRRRRRADNFSGLYEVKEYKPITGLPKSTIAVRHREYDGQQPYELTYMNFYGFIHSIERPNKSTAHRKMSTSTSPVTTVPNQTPNKMEDKKVPMPSLKDIPPDKKNSTNTTFLLDEPQKAAAKKEMDDERRLGMIHPGRIIDNSDRYAIKKTKGGVFVYEDPHNYGKTHEYTTAREYNHVHEYKGHEYKLHEYNHVHEYPPYKKSKVIVEKPKIIQVQKPKEEPVKQDVPKKNVKDMNKKEKSTDCDSALIPLLCVHG